MALHAGIRSTTFATPPPRLNEIPTWPAAVAFTGCLTVVAVSSALGGLDPWVGLAALGLVAMATARRARPLVAVAISALAWLFYDGFIADALARGYQPGALHWHGTTSVLALGLLVVLGTAASLSTHADTGEPRHG